MPIEKAPKIVETERGTWAIVESFSSEGLFFDASACHDDFSRTFGWPGGYPGDVRKKKLEAGCHAIETGLGGIQPGPDAHLRSNAAGKGTDALRGGEANGSPAA